MIAVTGANGLLGSFIVRKLVEMNLPVTAVVRKGSDIRSLEDVKESIVFREADVLDFPALLSALEGAGSVVHGAAMVTFNPRKAKKIAEVNIIGTRNVVDACLGLEIGSLVHISSVAALGRKKENDRTPVDEDAKWIDSDLNSDYASSKYQAELEVFRGQEEGLRASMINPSVILAPANWDKSSAQLFRYVWQERMFYTEGSLNYVDVRDVTDMVVKLLLGDFAGKKFIASAGSVSLKEFFDAIAVRLNKRPPGIKVSSKWTGIVGRIEEWRSALTGNEPLVTRQSARLAAEEFWYSNDRAKNELQVKFRGLEETLDWCCEAYLRKININKQK